MRVAGLCGLGLLALSTTSFAADLPVLRGAVAPLLGYPAYYRWDGIYFGGQGGWNAGGVDFANATKPLLAYILRDTDIESEYAVSSWTTLPKRDTSGANYGGFIGYNFQWDDAVLGVEVNYNRSSFKVTADDSMRRVNIVTSIARHDVTVSATGTLEITDYATLRGRAGWAFGSILPYVTGGVAIARGNVIKEAHVRDDWCDVIADPNCTPTPQFSPSSNDNRDGTFAYGYAIGGGVDCPLRGSKPSPLGEARG
jgi:outer membrane immunogenic protein